MELEHVEYGFSDNFYCSCESLRRMHGATVNLVVITGTWIKTYIYVIIQQFSRRPDLYVCTLHI